MAIVGVGHAIVDLFVEAEAEFLAALGIEVGTMVLADPKATSEILDHLSVVQATSGGSAANTMVGIASLGSEATLIGTVAKDSFGERYVADLGAAGVRFETRRDKDALGQTGHCVVIVTPGGQRTMLTHLGASSGVGEVIDALIAETRADIVYFEGYVLDSPGAAQALAKMIAAGDPSRRIALSLSDRNVVERRRDQIWQILKSGGISILLCNEAEACELTGTSRAADAASLLSAVVAEGAITLGADGALVFSGDQVDYAAALESEVVDTTGAGDLFAAGYLVATERGKSAYERGLLGCVCAAEVVSHFGARPEVNLAEMARSKGL